MARKGFSLDFDDFLAVAEEISSISDDLLLKAAVDAVEASRVYINEKVGQAMKKSEYSFKKGEGYSQGDARASLIEVSKMPIEVSGTEVVAYAGVDLADAPEALILAVRGAPNGSPDLNLRHALKVKGKVRKQVDKIQENIFNEALKGALNND